MQSIICVSSLTQNTYRVARYAKKAILDSSLVRTTKDTDVSNFDFIIVAFYLDKGKADGLTQELLPHIKGKKVALLGTLGGDPKSNQAKACMDEIKQQVLANDNKVIGSLWIRGKISKTLIEAMHQKFPNLLTDTAHLERITAAAQHPNGKDYCLTYLKAQSWYKKALRG